MHLDVFTLELTLYQLTHQESIKGITLCDKGKKIVCSNIETSKNLDTYKYTIIQHCPTPRQLVDVDFSDVSTVILFHPKGRITIGKISLNEHIVWDISGILIFTNEHSIVIVQ